MNNHIRLSLGIVSILCLVNMTEETSVDGHKKQKINFYGVLTTRQGESITIDNIAVGGKHKQIVLFENAGPQAGAADNKHMLTNDPQKGIITKIDLAEVTEIRVPAPDVIWLYQPTKKHRKYEYIEIAIISGGAQKTENHYLIDLQRKITCEQPTVAGAIEKEVPFQAIRNLTIKGHCYRQEQEKPVPCSVNSTACQAPQAAQEAPVKQNTTPCGYTPPSN